ncbi:FkbM family methyltransferase [Nocardioides gansuensis]|uniref:FkbM family methyltransferase n=1 Tax=Nocardioides gansuensis TaxID=2138300 RepID=UPI0014022E02|nr:FkbM family methyltransferase [Nocardioides gansuensis]
MTGEQFISYAQNREDVVLWRALGNVQNGRYVEIGANDPVQDSITKAFYDRGWTGLVVEPDPVFAGRVRRARPLDHVVEAAVTSAGDTVTLHRAPGTGMSSLVDSVGVANAKRGITVKDLEVRGARLDVLVEEAGLAHTPVHFLMVDVEGAEADVLASVDLRAWRPWVLVIEATEPNSTRSTRDRWEPGVLAAGYTFCLFDGVSCFYVADEHAATLREPLSYPACALDHFIDREVADLGRRLAESEGHLRHWRSKALRAWGAGVGRAPTENAWLLERSQLLQRVNELTQRTDKQAERIKVLRRKLAHAERRSVAEAPGRQGGSASPLAKTARSLLGRSR